MLHQRIIFLVNLYTVVCFSIENYIWDHHLFFRCQPRPPNYYDFPSNLGFAIFQRKATLRLSTSNVDSYVCPLESFIWGWALNLFSCGCPPKRCTSKNLICIALDLKVICFPWLTLVEIHLTAAEEKEYSAHIPTRTLHIPAKIRGEYENYDSSANSTREAAPRPRAG